LIGGVPKETMPGERRVAIVPESISKLRGISIKIEHEAGTSAGIADPTYVEQGATVAPDRDSLYRESELVLKVQPPTPVEAQAMAEGVFLVSFLYPQTHVETVRELAQKGATVFAMELMPRISRAQSMDALSSQSMLAGYKAVLFAADSLPKFFPMSMTAAGTIAPARVFVLGAGVAGLEAIATARRLGAVVEAYDVRPAVKEQIESLGAKFVESALEAKDAQTSGGYARVQSDEFYRNQQELLASHVGQSDVVITTALVPGRKAPILITDDAVRRMRQGSVIVDLAAEQGGNCALTEAGKTIVRNGVTIHGPLNLPSSMAPQASQLYSRNISSFVQSLLRDGSLNVSPDDELVKGTLVVRKGNVVHEPTRALLEGARP